jgi:hypothetical protein
MQSLLTPFSPAPTTAPTTIPTNGAAETGSNGVQENLVTRNGELEAELQRMRMLLVRVGGRVGMLREQRGEETERADSSDGGSLFSERDGGGHGGEEDDVGMDEERKVGLLLERF